MAALLLCLVISLAPDRQQWRRSSLTRPPCFPQVRKFASEQYQQNGMTLHPGRSPTRVVKNDDGTFAVTVASKGGEETTLEVDVVMAATGGCLA